MTEVALFLTFAIVPCRVFCTVSATVLDVPTYATCTVSGAVGVRVVVGGVCIGCDVGLIAFVGRGRFIYI